MSAEADAASLRIAKAFLIAPMFGSIVLAGWYDPAKGLDWLIDLFGMALFAAAAAYSIALVVGVPAYLVLRRRLRPRLGYVVISGGLVAAAPLALFGAIDVLKTPKPSLTWAEVIEFVGSIGPIFAAGAVTGLVFWLVAVWRDPNPNRYLANHGAKGSRPSISS
jgi:hypothetical protein